jgi:diadenosine tetraphosphate (Ap4A) HIT family hydrolase
MGNCIFCKEISLGVDGVVYETKNFYIKIGKAIICDGHCMIITKDHYACMGAIGEELVDEYVNLKDRLIDFVTKQFYKPFIVEHGVFMQSVYHAHIHFIPRKSEYFEEVDLLRDMIYYSSEKENIELENINDFYQIKKFFETDKEYLYFEQDGIKKLVRSVKYRDKINKTEKIFSYRKFFNRLGLVGIEDWKFLTEKELEIDNQKVSRTCDVMKRFAL